MTRPNYPVLAALVCTALLWCAGLALFRRLM